MPRPDPIPNEAHPLRRRFWRILRLLAMLSAAVAGIAILLVAGDDEPARIHLLIATGLGVFLMTLIGTALMSLVFLSATSGHDDAAGGPYEGKNDWKDDLND